MESEIVKAVRLLNDRHHILSKNYHDGFGRQYWLRDSKQKEVMELDKKQIDEIKEQVKLTRQSVMSSDEAFILATKEGHEAWV